MTTELWQLSAANALALMRAKTISPVELLTSIIARAEETEPAVNALTFTFFDQAMDAARESERRYMGGGGPPRPMEGIPLGIKEEMPVAGQPCTSGSLVYKDEIATHTSPLAARMLDAGAIIHARTACPEFSCAEFTHSRLFGITRNPWNLAFDVGGSSGGAAASLAAGSTMLAGGSDIGGSIRIPASCCGVAGYKPPYGRVPQDPPFNLDHYCHEGPLARTVEDARLFQNVIAGPDPDDVASLRPKLEIPPPAGSIRGWKVALSVTLGDYLVDDDVAANTLAAADAFREAGAVVEEVELPWTREEISIACRTHFSLLFAAWVKEIYDEHRDLLTPYAIAFANEMLSIPASPLAGMEIEGKLYSAVARVLEEHQILLCPAMALPALEAGKDYTDEDALINGVPSRPDRDVVMTPPFNICSRCPVMSVPSGLSRDGVPTGLQIVGRTYDDLSVFEAAAAFERIRPWGMAPVS
ncbi:MAG: amidase [Thermomicrobiales bacterium]|jgi:aspartyl-tRNA(Asn)/glutamyl-tRNA(Gln) amidotransferase subunit A|nr:amidase [Thermomicrobiales bacterium]